MREAEKERKREREGDNGNQRERKTERVHREIRSCRGSAGSAPAHPWGPGVGLFVPGDLHTDAGRRVHCARRGVRRGTGGAVRQDKPPDLRERERVEGQKGV